MMDLRMPHDSEDLNQRAPPRQARLSDILYWSVMPQFKFQRCSVCYALHGEGQCLNVYQL